MSNFTDGLSLIATEKHVNAPWSGDKKNFRCGFCGYKFVVGDYFRWIFTNDINGAGGNPLVCKACDTGNNVEMREKWCAKWAEWNSGKFWWFIKNKET